MQAHFLELADYNCWANQRIYEAAGQFSEAERQRDVGAYFSSLHGTLAHILVADRIWLARLRREDRPYENLDDSPCPDFDSLSAARREQDDLIEQYIRSATDAEIAADHAYKDMSGTSRSLPRRAILTHMFNHATHHRGQAHHILKQLGMAEPPPLDLPYRLLDLL